MLVRQLELRNASIGDAHFIGADGVDVLIPGHTLGDDFVPAEFPEISADQNLAKFAADCPAVQVVDLGTVENGEPEILPESEPVFEIADHGSETEIALDSTCYWKRHLIDNSELSTVVMPLVMSWDRGKPVEFEKKGAGGLKIQMQGTGTIADSTEGGGVQNLNPEAWGASISLRVTAEGKLSLNGAPAGNWETF